MKNCLMTMSDKILLRKRSVKAVSNNVYSSLRWIFRKENPRVFIIFGRNLKIPEDFPITDFYTNTLVAI